MDLSDTERHPAKFWRSEIMEMPEGWKNTYDVGVDSSNGCNRHGIRSTDGAQIIFAMHLLGEMADALERLYVVGDNDYQVKSVLKKFREWK